MEELTKVEKVKRTAAEQVAELDRRLGVGIGARRERAKLAALLPVEAVATTQNSKRKKEKGTP